MLEIILIQRIEFFKKQRYFIEENLKDTEKELKVLRTQSKGGD